jgi:hypothetical protein
VHCTHNSCRQERIAHPTVKYLRTSQFLVTDQNQQQKLFSWQSVHCNNDTGIQVNWTKVAKTSSWISHVMNDWSKRRETLSSISSWESWCVIQGNKNEENVKMSEEVAGHLEREVVLNEHVAVNKWSLFLTPDVWRKVDVNDDTRNRHYRYSMHHDCFMKQLCHERGH